MLSVSILGNTTVSRVAVLYGLAPIASAAFMTAGDHCPLAGQIDESHVRVGSSEQSRLYR